MPIVTMVAPKSSTLLAYVEDIPKCTNYMNICTILPSLQKHVAVYVVIGIQSNAINKIVTVMVGYLPYIYIPPATLGFGTFAQIHKRPHTIHPHPHPHPHTHNTRPTHTHTHSR